MPYKPTASDYEPVTPLSRARTFEDDEGEGTWLDETESVRGFTDADETLGEEEATEAVAGVVAVKDGKGGAQGERVWSPLKRGHGVSFVGLLLFTAFVYFRPYELIPALAPLKSGAFWLALATLAIFIPTQLALEGTPTARPREVNLVLLLLLAGLMSVPLAIEPAEAWGAWVEFAKVVTMFIVMINVVRTELRLRAMFWIALLVSVVLSFSALNDYRAGRLNLNGTRIEGVIEGGMFGNPNDMALHLVTMIPLVVGLWLIARGLAKKAVYVAIAILMLLATIATLSRGGLLGLACASFLIAWKVGRRNRALVVIAFVVAGAVFLVLLPPEFTLRLLSIFGGDADGGSAVARQGLLFRSIYVTLLHPLLGVGMNNFHILSIHEQVSHNAYTQVSAEIGVPALIAYMMFMLSALKRLRQVERETFEDRARARVYYLAVGLQASMVAYMVSSFFASVAYLWYIYFLAGYALCLHRLYESKGSEAFGRAARTRIAATDHEGESVAGESEDEAQSSISSGRDAYTAERGIV